MSLDFIKVFYVAVFFLLSIAIHFISRPAKDEYINNWKARKILGFAFMMIVVTEILRMHFPVTGLRRFLELVSLIFFSFAYTSLNFVSFLYMLETPRKQRQEVKKTSVITAILLVSLGITGYIFVDIRSLIKATMSGIYTVICLYQFTRCIREYDKLTMSLEDCDAESLNIKWMYPMLWMTGICAFIMACSFFYKPFVHVSAIFSLVTYSVLTVWIINFGPANLNAVRNRLNSRGQHPMPAQMPATVTPAVAASTPVTAEIPAAEEDNDEDSLEIKGAYSKIEPLVKRWVDEEMYTSAEINIRDAAMQMGTNSNYLSQYINKELKTSFSTWLNTLRIEKSKEYLTRGQRMSIEEVGSKVGYTNIYNYSRWFKIVTGMSPSEWRKAQ